MFLSRIFITLYESSNYAYTYQPRSSLRKRLRQLEDYRQEASMTGTDVPLASKL